MLSAFAHTIAARVGPQGATAATAAGFIPAIVAKVQQPGDAASGRSLSVGIKSLVCKRLMPLVNVHMNLQAQRKNSDRFPCAYYVVPIMWAVFGTNA